MKSYRVEIVESNRYILDVRAKNEGEAKKKASKEWNMATSRGMEHYNQFGDTEVDFGMVYDVTGTDDDFIK